MKKKRKKSKNWIYTIVGIIFLGVASWSFYSMANMGANDLLRIFGISNFYIQSLIVIIFVLIALFLMGKGIARSIEKMIKG